MVFRLDWIYIDSRLDVAKWATGQATEAFCHSSDSCFCVNSIIYGTYAEEQTDHTHNPSPHSHKVKNTTNTQKHTPVFKNHIKSYIIKKNINLMTNI